MRLYILSFHDTISIKPKFGRGDFGNSHMYFVIVTLFFVMQPAYKTIEIIDQQLIKYPLRGVKLFYIT